jgi:hypothetical protein
VKRFVPVLALALTVAFPLGAPAAKHAAGGTTGATSPTSVTCAAGDPVVWVNTETKVYHMAGSAYYGKTKHGKYACASDAAKMGAHAAKRESGKSASMGGESSGGAASGSATGEGTRGGKHHRHKGGSMTSPMPNASPVPQPTSM